MRKSDKRLFLVLVIVMLLLVLAFLTVNTYGNWSFALNIRGKKIVAFLLVALATSFATISFQTLTNNHFLTPNILGFDSLYVLLQTVLFFIFGQEMMQTVWQQRSISFGVNVGLMVTFSTLLFYVLLKREQQNLYLLLMIGMILGTLFSSFSTFLQVLLDPNEYDKLQGKLFASFSQVDTNLLLIGSCLIGLAIVCLWLLAPQLDVLHLGQAVAINLGIEVKRLQWQLLLLISLLVAVSTALVGPVTFLGFIVVNVSYRLFKTYHHRTLFIGASLVAFIFLIFGQLMVEQVFKWQTTMSVVIEFIGGLYFVGKLLQERKH